MTESRVPARPGSSTPRPYQFPSFERRRLPNGLTLIVAPVHKLPVVSVHAVVHAGAQLDPPGREGLSALAASLLTEGVGGLDGAALTERFEQLGTGLDAGADWDATHLRLTVTPPRLPAALAMLGEVVRAPTLPERELERLRAERLAELLQLRAEPRGLADEAFARAVYERGARYALPEAGTEESVNAVTLADVRTWHRERFTPSGTTLIVAGDISTDDCQRIVADVFGSWKASGAAEQPVVRGYDSSAGDSKERVWLVPREEAAQSEVRVGHIGLPRNHPDFFPAAVMNAILGGLFSSRINLNLREQHGYTYGAFSEFDWRVGAGPFVVSSAVQSESTGAAVKEVLSEIARIRAANVEEAELSLATSFLQGVFPIRYETTAAIAGALANMAIYGLPEDYFDRYRERIGALNVKSVRSAAEKHLRLDELRVVVVGRADQVRDSLESLGLGTVKIVDADVSAADARTQKEVSE